MIFFFCRSSIHLFYNFDCSLSLILHFPFAHLIFCLISIWCFWLAFLFLVSLSCVALLLRHFHYFCFGFVLSSCRKVTNTHRWSIQLLFVFTRKETHFLCSSSSFHLFRPTYQSVVGTLSSIRLFDDQRHYFIHFFCSNKYDSLIFLLSAFG